MLGLVEFSIKEKLESFSITKSEDVTLSINRKYSLDLTCTSEELSHFHYNEELCDFSFMINLEASKSKYEPLFCKDGILYDCNNNPFYVLKWTLGIN